MRGGRRFGWGCIGVPLLLFLILPLGALIARIPPGALPPLLRSSETLSAIRVTLLTTGVSTGLLMVTGFPLAFSMARLRRRPGWIAEGIVTLPAILPPSVAGIALLLAFGRRGVLGPALEEAHLRIPFTTTAVVLAQVFVAAPFLIRPSIAAFRGLDPHLFEAAALDGASANAGFFRLALPAVRPALVRATSMAWARAMGEFGATLLFAGNRPGVTQTMPLAIYLGFESDLDQAVALSVVLLLVAGVVVVASLVIPGRTTDS